MHLEKDMSVMFGRTGGSEKLGECLLVSYQELEVQGHSVEAGIRLGDMGEVLWLVLTCEARSGVEAHRAESTWARQVQGSTTPL